MEENKVATDSSAPNSPELTRLSGEQAEERTAREPMTKHTKDAHIADSASHGKGESMATETRKGIKMQYKRAPYSGVVGIGFFDQNNFIAVAIPPRETKEATEQLADIIEAALKAAEN